MAQASQVEGSRGQHVAHVLPYWQSLILDEKLANISSALRMHESNLVDMSRVICGQSLNRY